MEFLNNNFTDTAFRWFTGVIEDINDPSEMGRVRVRCFGYHSSDRDEIPTSALPLAHVMMPITSASCSGVGESATGILAGSWVVGFFRDGEACQDPIILGTLPSQTPKTQNYVRVGFSDPTGAMPRTPGEVDNPRGSRTDYSSSYAFLKKDEMQRKSMVEVDGELLGNPTAVPPNGQVISGDKPESYFERKRWEIKDPFDTTQPTYPNNHVKEYLSGHTVEYDDTVGKERILNLHKSGTYEEIDNTGDRTVIVNGNDYQVVMKDQNVSIKGNVNLTIDEDVKTLIKGNYHLEVEKDYTMNIHGNIFKKVGLSEFNEVVKDVSTNIKGKLDTRIGKGENRTVTQNSTLEIVQNQDIQVGQNLTSIINGNEQKTVIGKLDTAVNETFTLTSTGNFKLDVAADIDIDAGSDVFMDAPTGSIDFPAGNITSNTITLHTHTHSQPSDLEPVHPDPQSETNAPTSGT